MNGMTREYGPILESQGQPATVRPTPPKTHPLFQKENKNVIFVLTASATCNGTCIPTKFRQPQHREFLCRIKLLKSMKQKKGDQGKSKNPLI